MKHRTWLVAIVSLAFTWILFYEYLPPVRRVHVPYDIHGYHYPLLHYAFDSIRQGRMPEWDAAIYCGISLVGNVQAAIFYPPNWLMFAGNLGRRHLSYKSLEGLVFAHHWLAFLLFYVWMRHKSLGGLAAIFGGGVFAYAGYMMSQNSHAGVVTGFAWAPLGLWGIDQAIERRTWRPLWKVAAASALCFLAGYPANWVALCVCFAAYAAASTWSWRLVAATCAAIAYSLLLVMVQLAPAQEASAFKTWDPKYGSGVRDLDFYAMYLVPNYYDFGQAPTGPGSPGGQYMYLGPPGLVGLALAAGRRRWRELAPGLAVGLACLVGVTNPLNLVWQVVRHSDLLTQLVQSFHFLAGMTLAIALLSAIGIDAFLRAETRQPHWLAAPAVALLLVAWSARRIWIWLPGKPDLASGWTNVAETAVLLVLFSLGLYVLRAERGARRAWLAAVLMITVAVDYKAFGSGRRFNADTQDVDRWYASDPFIGMNNLVYEKLAEHPESRVVLADFGPHPTDLRHHRLSTPQGFDPFLTVQYRTFIENAGETFYTNRLFKINPDNEPLLRWLGVRYFIAISDTPVYRELLQRSDLRLLEPANSFFRAFEYIYSGPAYYWDPPGRVKAGPTELRAWLPEYRELKVRSQSGGQFVLAEQFFPGWRAWIDGRPAAVARCKGTFQSIDVPPGEHVVQFRFRSVSMRIGALVSLLALAGLVLLSIRFRWPGDAG